MFFYTSDRFNQVIPKEGSKVKINIYVKELDKPLDKLNFEMIKG